MSEKALKAVEVFFDTVNRGEAAIMGFKMNRPVASSVNPADKVVTFYFDREQLDWLIMQMAQHVQRETASRLLWTPGHKIKRIKTG